MDDLFSIDVRPNEAVKRQLSKKNGKATRRREQSLAEREAALAKLVFQDESLVDKLDEEEEAPPKRSKRGSTASVAPAAGNGDGSDEDGEGSDEDDAEEVDARNDDDEAEEEGDEESEDDAEEAAAPVKGPAWEDEDDAMLSVDVMKQKKLRKLRKTKKEVKLAGADYEERLRAQWRSTQRNASWADAAATEAARGAAAGEPDKAEALLRSAAPLLAGGGGGGNGALGTGKLSIKRVSDLNVAAPSHSCVSAVQWHPNAQLAMTAGLDKVFHLFRVDGEENTQMQAVHVPRMQIRSAAFSADGAQVLVCGEKSKMWGAFDLHAGRMALMAGVMGRTELGFKRVLPSPDGAHLALLGASGSLLLLSARTKQLVATLQPGGGGWGCQCAEFSPRGDVLYAAGQGGQVQVWDVARRCCVHSWHDRGGLRTTALAASPDGTMVATGSDSGAVCLYGTRALMQSDRPEPTRELLQLRHPISSLAFNAQSEALAFASKYTGSAMRIAHVGSQRVFPNWPTGATPLSKVECVAFSPHSAFVAAGNDKGRVLLYRLNHYMQA